MDNALQVPVALLEKPKHVVLKVDSTHLYHNVLTITEVDFEQPSFLAESSFIHAPLNSRVPSRPAPSPIAVSKGKEREREGPSLIGVPVEIQDALLCEDLLFVLMVRCLTFSSEVPSQL